MTLTEFLEARITEDEAVARAVQPNEYLHDRDRSNLTEEWHNGYTVVGASSGRVLAQCAAHRRIVVACSAADSMLGDEVLRALAVPYVDHPDYREEWAL